jgi:DMSO/TMAO reductase YedYZ molybdopterin-dependent catalytic subunit
MKKTTKIVSIILIAIIVTITMASTSLYYPNGAQTAPQVKVPDGVAPEWQIKVSGNVEQQKTWTLEEITQMPLTRATAEVNGENATFGGVALVDFCNKTGAMWDTQTIKVISTDGQIAALNIFQAWNSTAYPYYKESNRIVLAFIKNGEWMTQKAGGPVKLITPSFGSEYQIDNVAEVNVESWTVSISGAVAKPLTISSRNLTNFQQETVHAAFVPGDGDRTSNWTGISMLDVLDAANMSYRAEKLTIVAIDGYVKNYTLQEVEDSNMLIGFEENGSHLGQSQGGPYRLFCPVEKYKWAQFWVKFVSEIIVT